MTSASHSIVPCPQCRREHQVSGQQIRDGSWLRTPCQKGDRPAEPSSEGGSSASPNPGAAGGD